MDQKNIAYTTDSFLLASYLLAESCSLLRSDKTNPRRIVFVFQDSEKLQSLIKIFLSHKSHIEPHRFYSAMKDLKQIIHSL